MTGGFVRAARASDAAGLARVQVASWRATLAELVPDEVLAELTSPAALDQFAERWLEAIVSPPTSKHRVHVAVAEPGSAEVAGFAAAGPATDEDLWAGTDAELYELHVLPELASAPVAEEEPGHDSRLLHAVADAFAEDGFRTAYTWALSGDESRIAFLSSAGWGPDGSTSNLDMGVKVPVVRLHTQLSPPDPSSQPSRPSA
jgi:ribosomal protein S18 acetylase RimI-like enzyme